MSPRLSQFYCLQCRKDVDRIEITRFDAGRRVMVCAIFCHETDKPAEFRICEDQFSRKMRFTVFGLGRELECAPVKETPKLTDNKPAAPEKEKPRPRRAKGEVIDVEMEVTAVMPESVRSLPQRTTPLLPPERGRGELANRSS
jgi:hypothetical protein